MCFDLVRKKMSTGGQLVHLAATVPVGAVLGSNAATDRGRRGWGLERCGGGPLVGDLCRVWKSGRAGRLLGFLAALALI